MSEYSRSSNLQLYIGLPLVALGMLSGVIYVVYRVVCKRDPLHVAIAYINTDAPSGRSSAADQIARVRAKNQKEAESARRKKRIQGNTRNT